MKDLEFDMGEVNALDIPNDHTALDVLISPSRALLANTFLHPRVAHSRACGKSSLRWASGLTVRQSRFKRGLQATKKDVKYEGSTGNVIENKAFGHNVNGSASGLKLVACNS